MSHVYDRDRQERLELAIALLRRDGDVPAATRALRKAYPTAPEEMIRTAVHHLYVDGPEAALDWLAESELFLRGDIDEIGYGLGGMERNSNDDDAW